MSKSGAYPESSSISNISQNNHTHQNTFLPLHLLSKKRKAKSVSHQVEHACVLFFDIVNFTPLNEAYSDEFVFDRLLNPLFSKFDDLLAKYRAKKVKTCGDGYMVVAQTTEEFALIGCRMIDLAFAMMDVVSQLNQKLKAEKTFGEFEIRGRIGINLGPCQEVINLHSTEKDFIGKMVNKASRMESYSEPGKIQVSESVFDAVNMYYDFERNHKAIQGFGKLNTYYVKKSNLFTTQRRVSFEKAATVKEALKRTISLPSFIKI